MRLSLSFLDTLSTVFAGLALLISGQALHADDPPSRNDIHISGIYPHLTTYGIYSENGAHTKSGHDECGIGAIVPWAGKLWMINYAPHQPRGSEHKLYSIDPKLQTLTIHPESVGGTPAGRMIHEESTQLLMGHYLINAEGEIRVIPPKVMPMRVTAIARHLVDPANMVYYIDMEGAIWEANVHTLDVNRLFKKPVPGWHGKGGYTSQGRLVISNNGELKVGNYADVLVGGAAKNSEEAGVLAEWDGQDWRIVERRQYTDITGPKGIFGGSDGNEPLWAIGWDRRSLRLKLLENGDWHTYLLPKASYCNDAAHGWYTEWPRIRQITGDRWMMDMHGMFFDFPKTFSTANSNGLRPISSHLRYIPDFCGWNGQLVLATDETSIQGNPLAGQPQSNLWFGSYEDLKSWGPASGYGGPWLEDPVTANTPSDPFLVAGFKRRVLHLATGRTVADPSSKMLRATDQQEISAIPDSLTPLVRVTVPRGDWHQPAPGFEFTVDQPAIVYLSVDARGNPALDAAWTLTDLSLSWGAGYTDRVYSRSFEAGKVTIPGNATEHIPGSFGMPHMAFVQGKATEALKVAAIGDATMTPGLRQAPAPSVNGPVRFTLQIDQRGDGNWTHLESIDVAAKGYVAHILPEDLDAVWLRLSTDRDCIATAFLCQSNARFAAGDTVENRELFAGLAPAEATDATGARLYPAKHSRDLRLITHDQRFVNFTKSRFEFVPAQPDAKLDELLRVEPEFTVDEASVVVHHLGKKLRLPKGPAAFDKPFASGWPRAVREVESERHLANIHGTFYELPLISNGSPPLFHLMRPVASHARHITDFCTWNGLLVFAGVRGDAPNDDHVFAAADGRTALWFGGIDDIWKLGKPVGRGGPWKNSHVHANQPSDAYLMKGYDRKVLHLSHTSSQPVTVHVEVDITGQGHWHRYTSVDVASNANYQFDFPVAFDAAWVRLVPSADTTATAEFVYD